MRVSGVPWGGEHGHGPKASATTAGVVHNSYGGYGGDVSTVSANGSAHFVIGKDEGQWVQLADTDSLTWNCGNWNANNCSVAIEFTGTSDEDLTDWQVRAGAHVIREVSAAYGIPMSYDDGADGPNDDPPFVGWYSHRAIRPDGGSQHSDFISWPEWNSMVGVVNTTPGPGVSVEHKESNVTVYGTTEGKWFLGSAYGIAECDPGTAYVHAMSGVPVVRDLNPLSLVGICINLAKARKAADFWFSKI